jgi:hypothetical protein
VTWVLVVVLCVGTLAFKAIGPLLAGGVEPPPALIRVIGMLTPVLLAGLVVTSTFSDGRHLTVDARAAGLLVGGGLLLCRVPVLLALVLAAASTAAVRLWW